MIDLQEIDEDAVLKEVWNTDEIDAKTELNDVQIESVNKLRTMSDIFNINVLEGHVTNFLTLQKSRNRKSMDEFVSVVKAKREDVLKQTGGIMGGLMGR